MYICQQYALIIVYTDINVVTSFVNGTWPETLLGQTFSGPQKTSQK